MVLIIFGPGKLPDVGKALGKSIREFKSATSGDEAGKNKEKTDKDKTEKDNEKADAKE